MRNIHYIDYLRAFSVLYIVGYWHLFNYTEVFPYYFNLFTYPLTLVILGLFVFISGYLIARGYKDKVLKLSEFYKKRFLRIYPLYLLAVFIFYMYDLNSGLVSIKAALVLSMFSIPAPLTLWFITMLVLFYMVSPILLYYVDNLRNYILLIIMAILFILAVNLIFDSVDVRVFLYFPTFCLGIYCGRYGVVNKVLNPRHALVVFIFAFIVSLIYINNPWFIVIKEFFIAISGAYLIFSVCYQNKRLFKHSFIISYLSYASFAMYLFHRPVFTFLKELYFPSTGIWQVLYLVIFCLPVIILLSWLIQKFYEQLYQFTIKNN